MSYVSMQRNSYETMLWRRFCYCPLSLSHCRIKRKSHVYMITDISRVGFRLSAGPHLPCSVAGYSDIRISEYRISESPMASTWSYGSQRASGTTCVNSRLATVTQIRQQALYREKKTSIRPKS